LTDITMIHSHCIHNHIPVMITVVIYNSMHVASTRIWWGGGFGCRGEKKDK
jgi:hypothetical protein